MSLSIPVNDLVRWNDFTATKWRDFIATHPEVLDLPCDIRNSQTVGHLLQHVMAVELRYAQRLSSQPESDYADVAHESAEALFATHERALNLLHPLLCDHAFDWATEIEFQTLTMGPLRASRRAVLLHLLMHGIRHYAQLATLVRTHGFKPDWAMNYLFVAAVSA